MKIGIDATVLQGGHRMRGIGSTAISFINNLPGDAKKTHEFVFFCYEGGDDPLDLISTDDLNYEVRLAQPVKKIHFELKGILGRIGKINKIVRIGNRILNAIRWKVDLYFGDSRIKAVKDLDYFVQFDQGQPLPRGVRSLLVIYDLIPYVVESDYLMRWRTARASGLHKKAALRLQLKRWSYRSKIKRVSKKAWRLLAISEHTKHDFMKYLNTPEEKIRVWYLGVDQHKASFVPKDPKLEAYIKTSWGYLPKPVSLENKDFLLFVGGADQRRKLVDLLAAFNNLRAQGRDIKLVLSGDTMLGAENVPNIEFQKYIRQTSYVDDIYFLGFTTDEQREWLFKHAVAFIYPSVYEGFGLPVLEAMQHGTPVITYENSSLHEVAANAALFASDFKSIADQIVSLLEKPELREEYHKKGIHQAAKFPWKQSAKKFFSYL